MARSWTPRCSFCGLIREATISGQGIPQKEPVYICPDCVRLAYQMLEGPPLYDPSEPDEPSQDRSGD